MIGKVIKYNNFRETGIIYNLINYKTYLFKKCNAMDGDIGYGYIVDFYGYYDEESSRRCAKNIRVIECTNSNSKQQFISKKKKRHSKRKPTNASRYNYDNSKKFQKFVKDFMREQKNKKRREIHNDYDNDNN